MAEVPPMLWVESVDPLGLRVEATEDGRHRRVGEEGREDALEEHEDEPGVQRRALYEGEDGEHPAARRLSAQDVLHLVCRHDWK